MTISWLKRETKEVIVIASLLKKTNCVDDDDIYNADNIR